MAETPRLPHTAQSVASIKLSCSNVTDANTLIQGCIFMAGHRIAIRKDLQEPIRCNHCQLYGHIRGACKGAEHCATCANPLHPTTNCPPNTCPCCVSCGPDSTHASLSHNSPAFKKRCADLETRFPKNTMPYFPTGKSWSRAVNPPQIIHGATYPLPQAAPQPPSMSR
ncbi:hypothetical protein B0H34DRAFT_828875 [Crassisporium funariophilum]|nr:hypothetical protein B0H34DRAFT_828875 [Crassisporium funariophilum]